MRKALPFVVLAASLAACTDMTADELEQKFCEGEVTSFNDVDLEKYTDRKIHQFRIVSTNRHFAREGVGSSKWNTLTPDKRCELTKAYMRMGQ